MSGDVTVRCDLPCAQATWVFALGFLRHVGRRLVMIGAFWGLFFACP